MNKKQQRFQAATAAMQETPKFGEWQPIETAPKNGTEVIGWSKRHGTHIGHVVGFKKQKPEMPLKRSSGWFQPTHWQPLPEPPQE